MAVRKALLERELTKMGFRKGDAGRGTAAAESTASSEQESQSSHPQADSSDRHGD